MKETTTSGPVTHINPQRAMIAVAVEGNGFTIIELIGDEVEIGDALSWTESMPLGGGKVYSNHQRRWLDVYFQNHAVNPDQLRQQLLYE
ncbi:MAG TPA: hypothetical protein VHN77_03120 [Phycisphaerales bacterium]|nr:hypothetical protein [Phycisphaerales bacterium]